MIDGAMSERRNCKHNELYSWCANRCTGMTNETSCIMSHQGEYYDGMMPGRGAIWEGCGNLQTVHDERTHKKNMLLYKEMITQSSHWLSHKLKSSK